MTGEIIEVCQECGHVIDPVELTAPWGDRYRIMLCLRGECLAERQTREDLAARVAQGWYRRPWTVPIVNQPSSAFRITGTGV